MRRLMLQNASLQIYLIYTCITVFSDTPITKPTFAISNKIQKSKLTVEIKSLTGSKEILDSPEIVDSPPHLSPSRTALSMQDLTMCFSSINTLSRSKLKKKKFRH